MPRLREVRRGETDAAIVEQMYQQLFGDRDPVAEPGTATGTPGNWWTVFALVPDVLATPCGASPCTPAPTVPSTRRCASWARRAPAGPAAASSCSRSTASRAATSACPRRRSPPSRRGVWPPASARSSGPCSRTPTPSCSTAAGCPTISSPTSASHLSDEAILELTYITCMYEMHAVISRALRLEWDDRDEPVVEVAAPRAAARDIGADIAGEG